MAVACIAWLSVTVLWVSVTAPTGKNPAAVGATSRGAVSADGALGERHGANGRNPAAGGVNSRGAVSADGALGERHGADGINPAAAGTVPQCCFR